MAVSDTSSAFNAVLVKKGFEEKTIGVFGLLFYNSLFNLPVLTLMSYALDETAVVSEFDNACFPPQKLSWVP